MQKIFYKIFTIYSLTFFCLFGMNQSANEFPKNTNNCMTNSEPSRRTKKSHTTKDSKNTKNLIDLDIPMPTQKTSKWWDFNFNLFKKKEKKEIAGPGLFDRTIQTMTKTTLDRFMNAKEINKESAELLGVLTKFLQVCTPLVETVHTKFLSTNKKNPGGKKNEEEKIDEHGVNKNILNKIVLVLHYRTESFVTFYNERPDLKGKWDNILKHAPLGTEALAYICEIIKNIKESGENLQNIDFEDFKSEDNPARKVIQMIVKEACRTAFEEGAKTTEKTIPKTLKICLLTCLIYGPLVVIANFTALFLTYQILTSNTFGTWGKTWRLVLLSSPGLIYLGRKMKKEIAEVTLSFLSLFISPPSSNALSPTGINSRPPSEESDQDIESEDRERIAEEEKEDKK